MLIRCAELEGGGIADVRVERGFITGIGRLDAHDNEPVVEASGGLLLPGLHDHHIHVAALAASLNSVRCGPPDVADNEAFAASLQIPGNDWLRATGYHESVAGMLDVTALDRIVPTRPLRIQHRSGRMWFFNSAGLDRLLAKGPAPLGLEHDGSRYTGRLFDEDAWLQRTLGSEPPSFAQVGALLASRGVTGLTEMSPANDAFMARHFLKETSTQSLPQRTVLAGRLDLSKADTSDRVVLGPAKLHLHEAALPSLEDATDFIRRAHEQGRGVAVHCATEVEIIFTLAVFKDAGTIPGDRIEHASIAPDAAVEDIANAGIAVVSQPHFISERGDRYLADVDADARPLLYRLRAFLDADVTLAAGSDAPFGNFDPWASMAAAVSRQTESGASLGESEALTPEQALDLFLRDPNALNRRRRIAIGAPADLCLLDRSWADARGALSSAYVRATFIDGRMIFARNSNNSSHRLEGMT
ncbi:amidohydrolase [Steroidobacter agaridevorans]|uniref:Amidohydrolase n=1 Tax=Steroidobacter agaridevorans TaxID=2695856 RepID=A0A829Y9U5_9GAMM|nr:amidohydrolase family protein [Steroidobacter agaridevorans]GFE79815.1 amidohydrolase [Steroidobacter agaridevorans]GFE90641.1 amidohydrolase [Steroidobacter agaridevorans]